MHNFQNLLYVEMPFHDRGEDLFHGVVGKGVDDDAVEMAQESGRDGVATAS